MAIAFGNNHITTAGSGVAPHTGSFDLADNTTAIIVCVSVHANNESESVITAVTFGGVSCIESIQSYEAGADGGMSIWYLNSPNTSGSMSMTSGIVVWINFKPHHPSLQLAAGIGHIHSSSMAQPEL